MSEALEVNVKMQDETIQVDLIGAIDEDSDFSRVLSSQNKLYVFNFEKVQMMNSCGVREWINFIEKLPDDSTLIYTNCPQVVIEQINMVQGFLKKGAKIDSFYAPYYKESSDEVQQVLLKTEQIENTKAPEIKDPETQEILEFDAIEAQYFNFINQQKNL